jgi:hypothetical protein
LADEEAKPDVEKGPRKVASKLDKTQGERTKIRVEAVASSQQQPNRTVRFGKPDHPVSPGLVQKGASKTITPETTTTPHWCPLGLTPRQRRRI